MPEVSLVIEKDVISKESCRIKKFTFTDILWLQLQMPLFFFAYDKG